jgi:tetratricopeptide (TPR) repeat protein
MKFDKTKAMRSAERFLTQGKFEDAIREYSVVVEHDPKDATTLNILGDLYIKTGSEDKAVSCFSKVGDHYSKQGFAQKAIAVYKKVLKIDQNSIEISTKLAPLYRLIGSVVEARNHYNIVASHQQSIGKKVDALITLKQIAELDPTNTEIYIKLAEGFLEENQQEEAYNAYFEAGSRSAAIQKYEEAVNAFLGLLAIKPNDANALKGYVNSQLKAGNSEDAIEYLLSNCSDNVHNTELLLLLSECYLEANNPREAEKTIITIVEKEPVYHARFLDVTTNYLIHNDLESSVRVLTMASEHLLIGGKADEFKAIIEEVLARNPELVEGLRLLVRYNEWLNDDKELVNSLERLAESAKQINSDEDEKFALKALNKLVPHDVRFSSRLTELGEECFSDSSQDSSSVNEEEIPSFESFDLSSQTNPVDSDDSETDDFASVNDETFANSEQALLNNEEAGSSLSPQLEMHLHQELESVDFYISNEYRDLALDTLSVLEGQFGKHSEIQSRRLKLGVVEESEQTSTAPDLDETPRNVETSSVVELGFEVATSVEEDEFVSVETSGLGLSEDSDIDIDSMIDESVDNPSEVQFQDFREGLDLEDDSSKASNEDFETHFHMATAYKEMGLLSQAISEFQESVKHVGKHDKNRGLFKCYMMLGLCFNEDNLPKQSLKWYEKCLKLNDLNDDEKMAIRYEIALTHQSDGNGDMAKEHLEEIYGNDVNYRDVGSRLQSLRAN